MNLPSNPESELALIGCCLIGGLDTCIEVVEKVPSKAFMRDDCRLTLDLISGMVGEGQSVSVISVLNQWPKVYPNQTIPNDILASPDKAPSASSADYFVGIVLDCFRRRTLIYSASDLLKNAHDLSVKFDDTLAQAEQALSGHEITSVEIDQGAECATKLADHLEQRFNLQGKRSGLVTGLDKFDELTDGLQAGEQTIIAARPSMGKTAIGLNILEVVCIQNRWPALFVTLEMSTHALMRRLLSSWGKIPMGILRSGKFVGNTIIQAKIASFNGILRRSPLYVVNAVAGIDCTRLSAVIRRAVRKWGIKLVVVDYLQKIRPSQKQEKRTYEVGEVSGVLKAVADQTGVALLTLAQLNRAPEQDKGRLPRLSDLADSGQIERDADTVALLHRDVTAEDKGRKATLTIAKQRDGEVGNVALDFDGQFCRFNPRTEDNEQTPSN